MAAQAEHLPTTFTPPQKKGRWFLVFLVGSLTGATLLSIGLACVQLLEAGHLGTDPGQATSHVYSWHLPDFGFHHPHHPHHHGHPHELPSQRAAPTIEDAHEDAHEAPEEAAEPEPPPAPRVKPTDRALTACEEYYWKNPSRSVKRNWVSENSATGLDYSHMAMISRMPAGHPDGHKWIAVWQTAKLIEGEKNQHLRYALSRDARQWTASEEVKVEHSRGLWSPVLHLDQGYDEKAGNGTKVQVRRPRLFLFYTESTTCLRPADAAHLNVQRWAPGGDIKSVFSYDGIKWSQPKKVYEQKADGRIPKVIANQLVVHPGTGNWVLPFWHERPNVRAKCDPDPHHPATAGVMVSKNQGETWKARGTIKVRGTWLIEGSVAMQSTGDILMLFRTRKGVIYQAHSSDGGLNWSGATETKTPNPDSKLNVGTLDDGNLALAFNDMTKIAKNGKERYDRGRAALKVGVSHNDGKTWQRIGMIEEGDNKHYHHYPTLHQDGCRILVIYSIMRARPGLNHEHGVGGIRIAEMSLKGHIPCQCTEESPLEG